MSENSSDIPEEEFPANLDNGAPLDPPKDLDEGSQQGLDENFSGNYVENFTQTPPEIPLEDPAATSEDSPRESYSDPFALTPDADSQPQPEGFVESGPNTNPSPEFQVSDTDAPFASVETPVTDPDPSSFEEIKKPIDPLSSAKKFSEKMNAAQAVPASYPFSLLITGYLSDYEREKLIDILTRENMGIREVELEPQFASGKILIPRISEYAGILIVQALRGTRADLRLGPSDTIFSTAETREESTEESIALEAGITEIVRFRTSDGMHPAEAIRLSADPSIPDLPHPILIDLVMVSTSLQADTVEARNSPKYQETLDRLIRELKYKAHRKGASAIVNFSIELISLSLPSQYKLTVKGSAIRSA